MSFNVDSWRSTVKDSLPATLYQVVLTGTPLNGREVVLRAESVTTPGLAWLSVDNFSPYGNGKMYNIPYRYNPQEIQVVHTVDDQGELLKQFKDWGDKIIDFGAPGQANAKMGALFYKDYVFDMMIMIHNRNSQAPVKTYHLEEVFPTSVEPINFSWGSYDELAKVNVSYRYTKFSIN